MTMFVQVFEGRVADRDGFQQQLERWDAELKATADGFLGSTAGVTDDGHGITLARFESEDAAQANSERPEQGQWWAEAERCFDGEVTFSDSTEVDVLGEGGSDQAGFVQVMRGSGDRDRLRALDREFEPHVGSLRPDLLGGYRAWMEPDRYVEVAYFTSEAEARKGEQKEVPPELADQAEEYRAMMAGTEFLDLRRPMIVSR
jgi:hypothetical protein